MLRCATSEKKTRTTEMGGVQEIEQTICRSLTPNASEGGRGTKMAWQRKERSGSVVEAAS